MVYKPSYNWGGHPVYICMVLTRSYKLAEKLDDQHSPLPEDDDGWQSKRLDLLTRHIQTYQACFYLWHPLAVATGKLWLEPLGLSCRLTRNSDKHIFITFSIILQYCQPHHLPCFKQPRCSLYAIGVLQESEPWLSSSGRQSFQLRMLFPGPGITYLVDLPFYPFWIQRLVPLRRAPIQMATLRHGLCLDAMQR